MQDTSGELPEALRSDSNFEIKEQHIVNNFLLLTIHNM
jgi:hypothetical protein